VSAVTRWGARVLCVLCCVVWLQFTVHNSQFTPVANPNLPLPYSHPPSFQPSPPLDYWHSSLHLSSLTDSQRCRSAATFVFHSKHLPQHPPSSQSLLARSPIQAAGLPQGAHRGYLGQGLLDDSAPPPSRCNDEDEARSARLTGDLAPLSLSLSLSRRLC